MLKLFISKSKELDEKELSVLVALNGMHGKKMGKVLTSLECMGYFITGRFLQRTKQKDRTILDSLKSGLESLAEREIITILDQSGSNYAISGEGLEVDTEKEDFIVVEQWEMQRIFTDSSKPFNVFAFFVNLMGTVNNRTKEWHMSQDEMVECWGGSKRTINSYLDQLSDMGLVYVHRHKKRRADGTYHKLNNSYGRYCDKEAIIKEAESYADAVECEEFCEKVDRRAVKLRYNAYCGGAKKYQGSPDAVAGLYQECVAYNKSLEYMAINGYDGEGCPKGLLDLSVFKDGLCGEVPTQAAMGFADIKSQFTEEEYAELY